MSTEIVEKTGQDMGAALLEKVLLGGDLGALSAQDRLVYYQQVCRSLNLNPLTRPFEYLKLNGKIVLYARRDAADQLRRVHGISITRVDVSYQDDLVIVTVAAQNAQGRSDTDVGAVALGNVRGEARANAIKKCVTQAKRRVTLSICGLGVLDETEAESIPGAEVVVETHPAPHATEDSNGAGTPAATPATAAPSTTTALMAGSPADAAAKPAAPEPSERLRSADGTELGPKARAFLAMIRTAEGPDEITGAAGIAQRVRAALQAKEISMGENAALFDAVNKRIAYLRNVPGHAQAG